MKYFSHLKKRSDCQKCQNQCPHIQQGLVHEAAGSYAGNLWQFYSTTEHWTIKNCLVYPSVKQKRSYYQKNPDILIISTFHLFPTSNLIIIHINIPPPFNEMQKVPMCSFPKQNKVAQYIFKQSLCISLQFSTNQSLL